MNAQDEFGDDNFRAGIGAEAMKEILGQSTLKTKKSKPKKICAIVHHRSKAQKTG
jgi:hypothetical protein